MRKNIYRNVLKYKVANGGFFREGGGAMCVFLCLTEFDFFSMQCVIFLKYYNG